MKIDKYIAWSSFVISILAFLVSISCAFYQEEVINSCEERHYFQVDPEEDEAQPTEETALKEFES